MGSRDSDPPGSYESRNSVLRQSASFLPNQVVECDSAGLSVTAVDVSVLTFENSSTTDSKQEGENEKDDGDGDDVAALKRATRVAPTFVPAKKPGAVAAAHHKPANHGAGPSYKDQVLGDNHRTPDGAQTDSERGQRTRPEIMSPIAQCGPTFKGQADDLQCMLEENNNSGPQSSNSSEERSRSTGSFNPCGTTSITSSEGSSAAIQLEIRSGNSQGNLTRLLEQSDQSMVQAVLVEDKSVVWGNVSPLGSANKKRTYIYIVLAALAVALVVGATVSFTGSSKQSDKQAKAAVDLSQYNCSLPGLEDLEPGKYAGVQANYLSFATDISSPNFLPRAKEIEACTGGQIVFSEASSIWDDPVQDLGTRVSRGSELYDGYLMSYSHFPEISDLDLAEHLNERIRRDNDRLKWEDVLPQVKRMGEYRKNGATNIDFLMFDGDFLLPEIRLDLLEKYNLPLPNTWEETVELAKFFHEKDLNGDGEGDFGFCHFPRLGAGKWDAWFPEAFYATWATSDQTQGTSQGFFFDTETMEPRISAGFSRAVSIWKELWMYGSGTSEFTTGRCAIGFGPPGEYKAGHLNGVSRMDANGTVVWRPQMKSGEYAEPYRFRPFGSLEVVDRNTGDLVPCTVDLCPKAETVPSWGHHGDDDRASVLPPSPIAGRMINRAPFYWSGGLGTMIRKSAEEAKKELLWDFFLYTNSPATSVFDVPNYASWIDPWRYSQMSPGTNFLEAGWSQQAHEELKAIQEWATSAEVNGAFNIRLPGIQTYTADIMLDGWTKFIAGAITLDKFVADVDVAWHDVTEERGR